MGRFFRRMWKYFGASANSRLDERADPKIQIEQAIEDAQRQHQQLTQQAAAVLGNRRQLEMKLARQIDQVEKLQASARQSLVLLDQANAKGDTAAAASYEQAAQSFATQLVAAEAAMEDLKTLHDSALQSSEAAKKAVEQNAFNLRQKLAERSKLLTQLEHAKMQEQMNRSLASISELSVPGDTPTLGEVREKIEQRYANALGQSELASTSVEAKMLEVQKATIDIQAASRLDEIRSSMGGAARPSLDKARSGVGDGPSPALSAGGDATRSEASAASAPAAAPSGVEG